MKALTTLTKESVKGKNKSDVVRAILREIDPATSAPTVIAELKRLTGEEGALSLVYNMRNEIHKNGHTNNGQSKPTQPEVDPKKDVEMFLLSEVETFFKVRALVKEIGGVERMKAFLELVEKDQQGA